MPRTSTLFGSPLARSWMRHNAALVIATWLATGLVSLSGASAAPAGGTVSGETQQRQHDPATHQQIAEAKQLLGSGDLQGAAGLLRGALTRDPAHADAWALLGQIMQQGGALDDAALAYRQAVAFDAGYALAWYLLGAVLLIQEEPEAAIEALERANELGPNEPQTLEALGLALFEAGRQGEAAELLDVAVRLDPTNPKVRLSHSHVLATTDPLAAIASIRPLLEDHPDMVAAWLELGNLYLISEDADLRARATAALRRARELAPGDPAVHQRLIGAYWELGFSDDVKNEVEKLLVNHPDFAGGWVLRGDNHMNLRQYSEALAAIDRAIELEPDWPVAHLRRGAALERLMRAEEARNAYARALELAPGDVNAALGVARAALAMGDGEGALEAVALAGTQRSPQALRLRGRALVMVGRYSEAVAPLREAAASTPQDHEVWAALGQALQQLGDPEATSAIARAREISRGEPPRTVTEVGGIVPQRGEELLFTARVYVEEGRVEEALRLFEQAAPYFSGDPEFEEMRRRARDVAGPRLGPFADVASEIGLITLNRSGTLAKRYIVEMTGSGAGWIDYDRDGRLDAWLANGFNAHYVPLPNGGNTIEVTERPTDSLMRQGPGGRFADRAGLAGTGDSGWAGGVAVGDIDNDGWPDVYLTQYGSNHLYRNNGDGTFSDITELADADDESWSTTAAFSDLDNDGFLDLYVANYVVFDRAAPPLEGKDLCNFMGVPTMCGPAGMTGNPDLMLWNSGELSFSRDDQGEIADVAYYGLGVMLIDVNEDGLLDVYVADDGMPNLLFVNQGNRRFTEEALLYGLAYSGDGRTQAGMGIAAGDLEGDGRAEIMVTNFSHDTHTVYRNTGSIPFVDVTQLIGMGSSTFEYLSWGVAFRDFDLDLDLDAFIANGHIFPEVDRHDIGTEYLQRNQVFANAGGTLHDASRASGSGMEVLESSRAAVLGDYDRDGDEDILVTNIDSVPTLLRNDQEEGNGWLQIRLVGTTSNRDGIGARVVVDIGELRQERTVQSSAGYLGSSDPTLTFGFGDHEQPASVEVHWPSGTVERIEGIDARQLVVIVEGRGIVARRGSG